jgi:hypothetical protein
VPAVAVAVCVAVPAVAVAVLAAGSPSGPRMPAAAAVDDSVAASDARG